MYSVPPTYPSSSLIARPMSLRQLLAESLRLYRRHLPVFFSIALLMALPGLLLTLILSGSQLLVEALKQVEAFSGALRDNQLEQYNQPEQLRAFLWPTGRLMVMALGIRLVDMFLFRSLAIAATTVAVAEAYLERRPTLGAVFAGAFRRLNTLLLWGLLLGGLLLAPVFLMGLGMSSGALGLVVCMSLVLVAWPVFGLYLLVRLIFGSRAIAAEHLGLRAAWNRSRQLTAGHFWRVLGIALASVALSRVLTELLVLGGGALLLVLLGPSALAQMLQLGLATLAGAFFAPLAYISLTLLYYDQRRLQEPLATGQGSSSARGAL